MKLDTAKRRRVMERSMRLGHCICEPRRPCPCDVFRDQGICPCAGERPDPVDLDQIKLTTLVRNAGCASKIAPGDLEAVLKRLPPVTDPAVISGLAAADDAGIYRLSPDLCLVQTVDVFTPCVDDPGLFGRICAANCLSDIYAMGGDPRTALSILAFPSETMPGELMYRMLAGAMETLGQAGVALIGGHSIKDDEIKLGFAITGIIDPAIAAALDKPCVGDVLVLTKPLGTGVLAFAQQVGRGHPAGLAAAAESMATLNRAAAESMREAGASGCTDITGFGLFGHLVRMARQNRFTARVFAGALPAFDGVLEAIRDDVIPGALERNREFVGADLEVVSGVDRAQVHLGFDAQTSGGLLIAIAPGRLEALQAALGVRGVRGHLIGRITGESDGRILVTADAQGVAPLHASPKADAVPETVDRANPVAESHAPGCCSDVFGGGNVASSAAETQRAFGALMRSVQAAGALDAKTKELVLFGLVLQSRCEPCFEAHYARARELGMTAAELDEVAWCAVSMGGAPVKVFYQECLRQFGPGETA
ncbi:MAG: selenide, water dikinase SelD [Verrucomicrobia bacterium]|nr:selenide, water dikinase SelD [Verrucomicrobiota bacterium]